jgi:ribonuclease PH
MLIRSDGRRPDQLRPVVITPEFIVHPEGSVLIECGATRIVCSASLEDRVPPFIRGTGSGWVTSEYGMLPRSTSTRMIRESSKGRPSGRTQEIQRIIGRALRSVIDLKALGERTFWLDCDVIQADGGTRTASVTGAFVALALAVQKLLDKGTLTASPLLDFVAAVSVGVVKGEVYLDLAYEEDSTAEVDMNVVMSGGGSFVEIQGTAEAEPFDRTQLNRMLDLAAVGISSLIDRQKEVIGARTGDPDSVLRRPDDARSAGNDQ